MTMLSETMRLELAPLNVRVITLVAGGTKSKISDNGPPPESLPPTSPYLAVEKHIATKMDFKQMPTEIFAEQVVDDVVRGTTGKVWHGVGSEICGSADAAVDLCEFKLETVNPTGADVVQDKIMLTYGRGLQHMPNQA
jgi:hypothetical protein